jgi:GNAT superfamily N-acetyltransferase
LAFSRHIARLSLRLGKSPENRNRGISPVSLRAGSGRRRVPSSAVPSTLTFPPDDLAPGDARSAVLDLSAFRFDRIRAIDDPLFDVAYRELWAEFGATNEMERRETLAARFALGPRVLYEMILVRDATGAFVAARDHTAISTPDAAGAIVHLSHNLVAPDFRRTGIAGWLRALPIQAGRELLAGRAAPITLVAEMEYDSTHEPMRAARLRAYEKAGFLKIDPRAVSYHQPDFRVPAEIDATGGPRPVPFQLLVRCIGREHERALGGREVRAIVMALYDIYGPQFRPQDMAHPLLDITRLPTPETTVTLLPPTQ